MGTEEFGLQELSTWCTDSSWPLLRSPYQSMNGKQITRMGTKRTIQWRIWSSQLGQKTCLTVINRTRAGEGELSLADRWAQQSGTSLRLSEQQPSMWLATSRASAASVLAC
eukprot:1991730-Amphidinium_carterae.1